MKTLVSDGYLMFRVFVLLIAIMFGAGTSMAEESNPLGISLYGSFLHTKRVPNALFFFSDIKENDSFELRKAIRNHDIDTVVLSSKGGSVWEGLNMAGIIFDKGLKTYVPQKGLGAEGNCASACSFMFFGGSTRVADGKLGVHQFYSGSAKDSAQIGKTQSNAQFTVSEIIGFLNEFETPPFVFERMFQQKKMYYFNQNELEQIARIKTPITGDDVAEIDRFIADFVAVLAKLEDAEEPEVLAPTEPVKVTPETTEIEIDLVEPIEEVTRETGTTEVTETSEVKDKQLIKDIQSELNRLNCNAGIEDGIIGRKTRAAFRRYVEAGPGKLDNVVPFDSKLLEELKTTKISCKKSKSDNSKFKSGTLKCNSAKGSYSKDLLGHTSIEISDFLNSETKVTLCNSAGCHSSIWKWRKAKISNHKQYMFKPIEGMGHIYWRPWGVRDPAPKTLNVMISDCLFCKSHYLTFTGCKLY